MANPPLFAISGAVCTYWDHIWLSVYNDPTHSTNASLGWGNFSQNVNSGILVAIISVHVASSNLIWGTYNCTNSAGARAPAFLHKQQNIWTSIPSKALKNLKSFPIFLINFISTLRFCSLLTPAWWYPIQPPGYIGSLQSFGNCFDHYCCVIPKVSR